MGFTKLRLSSSLVRPEGGAGKGGEGVHGAL